MNGLSIAQIDLSKLPAVIDSQFVGITFDQMDFLTHMRFAHERNFLIAEQLHRNLNDALSEIEERDNLIHEEKQLKQLLLEENAAIRHNFDVQQSISESLSRDLRRQKRKTIFAWIVGGVATGVVTVLSLK